MRRKIWAIGGVAGLGLALVGCGGSSGDDLQGGGAAGAGGVGGTGGTGGTAGTAGTGGTAGDGGTGGAGGSGGLVDAGDGGDASDAADATDGDGGPPACQDGDERCRNDVHQICQSGAFVDAPCASGQTCGGAGTCVACACTPGEASPTCVDGFTRSVCNAACTGWTDAPCGAAQACTQGTCVACTCTPGESSGQCIDGFTQEVCSAACTGWTTHTCDMGQGCAMGACVPQICTPGAVSCLDAATTQVCNESGTAWEAGSSCGAKEVCEGSSGCVPLCASTTNTSSTAGCSFFALNMDNYDESHADAVTVANTHPTLTAEVTFFSSYGGVEAALQTVSIPALQTYTFPLPNGTDDYIHGVSRLRTGGAFRVQSDVPLAAYQHSPLTPYFTNDASCLLPEAQLGTEYVVASYADTLGSYPSYFDVIGTVDGTVVTITVPKATAGGTGVPALSAGGSVQLTLNRYDTLQIVDLASSAAPDRDVTGAIVTASAPVAVFGAVECAQVPAGYSYCDHLEEQSVPVQYWGKTYPAPHPPRRSATEQFFWRVIAQEDGTTIDASPPQAGLPATLNRGQFVEVVSSDSFVLTGDKRFAAFNYLSGTTAYQAGTGDPAQITAVPPDQFLTRYVLVTPDGYATSYLQIVRTTGDDVLVDGTPVDAAAYYALGAYTVADAPVGAGPHVVTSASPFGVVAIGYTAATSYGYPGGMGLKVLAQ